MTLRTIVLGLLTGAMAMRPGLKDPSVLVGPSEMLKPVEGRGEMWKSCEDFPDKRIVMVTVTIGYLDLFKNWLGKAKPYLQDTEHLHVAAEDEDVLAPLEELRETSKVDFSISRPHSSSSALVEDPSDTYGSAAYGSMVWHRPRDILSFLRKGCSVMYIDIDTVWMRDPFQEIDAAGRADLYFTDDNPTLKKKGTNYCAGFLYCHPTAAAQNLMESWGAASEGDTNQGVFNDVLAESAIDHIVLPEESYPPGFWADRWTHEDGLWPGADIWDPPAWYHANWVKGKDEKVKFFQIRDLWNPEAVAE